MLTLAKILLGISIILLFFIVILDSQIVIYLTVVAVIIEVIAGAILVSEFIRSRKTASWLNHTPKFDQNCLNAYNTACQDLDRLSELPIAKLHTDLEEHLADVKKYLVSLKELRYPINIKFLRLIDALTKSCGNISSDEVLTLQERSLMERISNAFSEIAEALKEINDQLSSGEPVDLNQKLYDIYNKCVGEGLVRKRLWFFLSGLPPKPIK